MREAVSLPIKAALNDLTRFDTIIDVRSPAEFALDHLPGAINLPVLSDHERHIVGLMHAEQSAFEGSRHGAALVSHNIAVHLKDSLASKPREWAPLVYCWRGGQRSNSLATVLARVGWRTHVLEGGHQAYRREIVQQLSDPALVKQSFRVVAGRTGCGKSLVLQELVELGEQVLDLEALAHHKGSVLGDLPNLPQPSQKLFESRIYAALKNFNPERVVYVESESKKVGRCHIPDALIRQMRAAPTITIQATLDWRTQYLLVDYPHFTEQQSALFDQIDCLTPLHGHEKIAAWKKLATDEHWYEFVGALLTQHYDPAYDRAITKNFKQGAAIAAIDIAGGHTATEQRASANLAAQTIIARMTDSKIT
jgi:tRNA 2-selenouridine synthase